MGFKKIAIDKYVELHLKSNPSENKLDLENRLESALEDYKNGVKCSCGNDIWVIGSAAVGNNCFACITGESIPTDDYEIDSAIKKRENKKGQKHIDKIKPSEIHGFFDDPNKELLCNMNRFDQKDKKEFKCFAYKKKDF